MDVLRQIHEVTTTHVLSGDGAAVQGGHPPCSPTIS